jgi:uncharacterized protein
MTIHRPTLFSFPRLLALAVRLLLVGAPLASALAQDLDTSSTPDVEAVGTGHVYAKPDTALATVGVNITAPTLTDALAQAAAASAKLVAAIKAQGVDATDIQTSSYNIYPVTAQPKECETAKITGYQVNYLYSVKIRAIDTTGKVLDAAVAAGANSVNDIAFTINDPSKFETAARALAVKDAQAKCQTLADTAGIKLGRVLSLTEQTNGAPPVYKMAFASAMNAPGGPPIETGQNDIAVSVEVHYEVVQ